MITLHYIELIVKKAEALQSLYGHYKTYDKLWKGSQEQMRF